VGEVCKIKKQVFKMNNEYSKQTKVIDSIWLGKNIIKSIERKAI
jgi:hypothetical protein